MYQVEENVPMPQGREGTMTMFLSNLKSGQSFLAPDADYNNITATASQLRKKGMEIRLKSRKEAGGKRRFWCI